MKANSIPVICEPVLSETSPMEDQPAEEKQVKPGTPEWIRKKKSIKIGNCAGD